MLNAINTIRKHSIHQKYLH